MGVVRAIGVGKTTGSVGDFTYRVVRGRTISSQKVAKRPMTRGQYLSLQQFVFGLINRFMFTHAADIMVSFNQSKYGSERNYFAKVNFAALREAFRPLYTAETPTVDDVSDAQIENAVTAYATNNPQSIYRVKRSGYEVVYLSGEWSSEQNPEEVNPALRVSFTSLQKEDGSAYSGSISSVYIVGNNLDRVTSITARGKEQGYNEQAIGIASFQLQGDGRLKVTFDYESPEPIEPGDFVELSMQASPQGSISWTK